jgi:hypothetical protein
VIDAPSRHTNNARQLMVPTLRLVEAVLPVRKASTSSVIDVLDHVLDKGIVVDAWVRLSANGIDLLSFDHLVVATNEAERPRAKSDKKR